MNCIYKACIAWVSTWVLSRFEKEPIQLTKLSTGIAAKMPTRNIIVIGATGKQGRSFIRILLSLPRSDDNDASYRVWAVTRNPSAAPATRLVDAERSNASSITVLPGDLNDSSSMRAIFAQVAGADGGLFGVFVVLAYPGLSRKSDQEARQGKVWRERFVKQNE